MTGTKPRQAYYAFAHQALPEIFFSGPQTLINTLVEHGASFLRYVWSKMEQYAEVDEDVKDLIDVQVHQLGQDDVAVVICPQPDNVTEAYFIAMLAPFDEGTEPRYFTLEYGIDHTGSAYTVLGEWTRDYIHRNHGAGPQPEVGKFLESIAELCK